MNELLPILSSVAGVVLIILIGVGSRFLGFVRPEADSSLAAMAAYVFLPTLFFDRVIHGDLGNDFATVAVPPVVGFLWTAGGVLIGWWFARQFGSRFGLHTDIQQRTFGLTVGICNYGYIPFPLAETFYPSSVIELVMHNLGVDFALWSVGVTILCGVGASGWKRMLVNPPLYAVSAALMVRFGIGVDNAPSFLLTTTKLMSDVTIPFGLFISGAIIADFAKSMNWKGTMGVVVAAVAVRQLVLPIGLLLISGALISTQDLRQVVMLEAAMPAALFPVVLARLFDKDTTVAVQVVLSTSLAGLVAIPLWLAIGKWWLAI